MTIDEQISKLNNKPLVRRDFLRGALAVGVMVPLGGMLASCFPTAGGTTAGGTVSATNPFGVAATSTVDVVIFPGGYGDSFATYTGKQVTKNLPGTTVDITSQTDIAQALQPRFVAGNPPDVIDNSGANLIPVNTIRDQLEDLTSVIEANNYEGKKIADTLFAGVVEPGTYDGKFVQLNYVQTVFAMWYSASLFDKNGWTVPKTWDEMLDFGAEAKAAGKYLMGWGKEAAVYYLGLCIGSAVKQGGNDVRLDLENLGPSSWSQKPVQQAFTGLKKLIDAGYLMPGGSGTQFTTAQAAWSNSQDFLLYPSGGWIENEMKDQTAAGFAMTAAPEPTVDDNSKLPYASLHSTAVKGFSIPSKGKNVAGGKEFLRAMLSHDAAVAFSKETLSATIVKDTVPADGFGSTALVSSVKLLENAGADVFSWSFIDLYGMYTDHTVIVNTFLQGDSSVEQFTADLQTITDRVANDPSIEKVTFK